MVQIHPGALHVPVAQWTERAVPNREVIRSSRIGDAMARDSPGERRSAKPPDGFDTRRVSTARRPRDQGSGVLDRSCAFESRRADERCSRYRGGPRWSCDDHGGRVQ